MSASAPGAAPLVSVLVVVRDAVSLLEGCIQSLWAQTYPAHCLEILVLDGESRDGTAALAQRLALQSPCPLRVLANPGRSQAAGWNLGVTAGRGRFLIRVDAQCRLAPDYIRICVDRMLALQAADPEVLVVGGRRGTAPQNQSAWARAIAETQQSPFGVGATSYRFAAASQFVDTLNVGLYDRRAFERVGPVNESLGRTEDNEFNARLRASGGKLFLDVDAAATYLARPTWWALVRQMYLNGWWISTTIRRQRCCPFRWYHFAPAALVAGGLGLGLASVLRIPGARWLWLAALGLYCLLLARASAAGGRRNLFRRAVVFVSMHLSYGAGTVIGFLPFFRPARWPASGSNRNFSSAA